MPLEFDLITGINTSNAAALKTDTQIRLAQLMGQQPNLNTGGVIMPRVPSLAPAGDPMANATPQMKFDSALKSWLTDTRRLDKDFMSGAGTETKVSAKGTERYLDEEFGYNPERDNEDFYAKRQSAIGEVLRGVFVRFPSLTVAKLGTGLGYLAGLVDPTNWGENYISSAADNAMARTFEGLEDSIKNDWLPSFQETVDQDKGFFERAFTDINFWTEDTVDAAAFLASAFVPGMAISKIGVGARASAALSRLGLASENGVLGNLGLTKLGSYMRNAQSLATSLDKTLIVSVNTASEAMWEAKQVRDSIFDSLTGKINPLTGQEYTDLEKRSEAGIAARNTFLANAALLSVSNLWEANLLYRALGKKGTTTANIGQSKLGAAVEVTESSSRLGKFMNTAAGRAAKDITKGIATEGFYEENAQLAVQRMFEGTGKYNNFVDQLIGQTRDAIIGDDTEAATSIGLGGIIGGLAGTVGGFKDRATQARRTQQLVSDVNRSQGAWLSAGNIYKSNPDGTVFLDPNGKPEVDVNKITAFMSQWQDMADLKNLMDVTDNQSLQNIIQKELMSKWVKAHINAGISDQIDTKLNELGTLGQNTLVEMGFDPNSPAAIGSGVADLKEYATKLIELDQTISNDILARGENLGEYELRKNYLYEIGARQLALQQQSQSLNRDLSNIKARIDSTTTVGSTDFVVDQLNYLNHRINAQRATLSALGNYELDGSSTSIEEENGLLSELENNLKTLINSNKDLVDQLKKKDNKYQYADSDRARSIFQTSYDKKLKEKAEIDNLAKSANNEFYRVADIDNGSSYYRSKLTRQLESIEPPTEEELDTPEISADTPDEPTGKTLDIMMKSNVDGQPVSVQLEEGRVYIGPLSSIPGLTKKGLRGTIFRNDKIKVVRINDDGSIGLSINGEPVVDFTQEELSQVPAFKKYLDLSPIQRFYLHNRNKIIKYRIPFKYNKATKKWETRIVTGRLSYDKDNDILKLAYKTQDGKTHYVEFNQKYMIGEFELNELPSDIQTALVDQQKRLDDLKRIQSRLFEGLINDTDVEIDLQKRRSEDNRKRIDELSNKAVELQDKLAKAQSEFREMDQTKISDRRTKASKLNSLISELQDQIGEIESLLSSLEEERRDILKRQAALEFMLDEYLTAYDQLLDTGDPLVREELTAQEELLKEAQAAEGNTNRFTTGQLEGLLEDTVAEIDIVESEINTLEPYVVALRLVLNDLVQERELLEMFERSIDANDLKNRIRTELGQEIYPVRRALLQKALSRVNKDPQLYFDIRAIMGDVTNAEQELQRFITNLNSLKAKKDRLTEAVNLRSDVNDTVERINYLKDVFGGLAKAFAKEKASSFVQQTDNRVIAKTAEDAKRLKDEEKLLSDFITEPPTPEDQVKEENYLFSDSFKPVLTRNNNPLYKSADSHYPDDQLNPQAYTQRFFKFTSQVNLDGSYYVLPITSDNDGQFGANIRFSDNVYKDDIKFVVVRKIGDKYIPVDINGNIISEPTIDNIVYSSLYGHPDLLSNNKKTAVRWVRDNFAVKQVSDDEIWAKVQEFRTFRENIKAQTKKDGNIYLPINSKSNGVQNREPKSVSTGQPQQLPVEGRLTPSSPNWSDVNLSVVTTGQLPGSTITNMKNGRLAIIKNDTVYQVYNRRLVQSEKDKIKRLLIRLVDTFGSKQRYEKLVAAGTRLTSQEEQQFQDDIRANNLITEYLSTILYWRGPLQDQPAIDRQFYVRNGYLYKGIESILFSKDSIEQQGDDFLDGVYHQISNVLLSAEYIDRPYNELDVDSSNNLTYKRWNSYKEYLLSSANRQPSEIPVYTNIVPDLPNDITIPQMKNTYLRFSPPAYEKQTSVSPAAVGNTTINTIQPVENMISTLTAGKYKVLFDNTKSGNQLRITLDYQGNGVFSEENIDIEVTKGNISEKTASGTASIIHAILSNYDVQSFSHPDEESILMTGYERLLLLRASGINVSLTRETTAQPNYNRVPANQPDPKLEATIVPPQTQPTSLVPPVETKQPPDPTKTGVTPQKRSSRDLLNKFRGKATGADDENVRVITAIDGEYVKENQTKVKNWFSTNLPQVPVTFTQNLINNKYWGQFKNGAIHIYESAEEGTGFHEAFEAIWNSILTPEQQAPLIQEFKRRANYKALLANTAKSWKGLNEDQLIKETLAEEFRSYVLADGKYIDKGQGKKNGFFRQLWNFIKSLFGLSTNDQSAIDQLFRDINRGVFAKTPLANYDSAVAHFRAVPGVTQEMTTMAIEGIASRFFMGLTQKEFNPESLFSKGNNSLLINNIYQEVGNYLNKRWETEIIAQAAYDLGYLEDIPIVNNRINIKAVDTWLNSGLSEDIFNKIDNQIDEWVTTNHDNIRDKRLILDNYDTSVKEIFYDYLRQFGFVIKTRSVESENSEELIEVETREANATDTLGIRDSITIDTRNTATTSVKLLIASLTQDVRVQNGYFYQENIIGLPTPVDFDKTSNILFNELQGVVSTISENGKVDVVDTMFVRLDNKYKTGGSYREGFEWINKLKTLLKYTDNQGNPISINKLNEDDIRLRVAFIKSYSKNKNNPVKLIMGDNNYIYSTDPIVGSNSQRIREAWENNAKANYQRSNEFLTIKNNLITFNTSSPRFQELMNSTSNIDRVELFRQLGITFSVPDLELTTKYVSRLSDASNRIVLKIKDGTITSFDQLFSTQIVNGPINELLSIEVENTADNLSLQYRNPEGQTEYSIVNPSNISNVANSLRNVTTLSEFILTNPQFGTISEGRPSLHRYQQGSELLTRILFDQSTGKKRKDLNYQLISGIAQMTEADGDITARLKRPDKILQEIFHMLNGSYYTIINSDKSSEFALETGEFVSMFDFTLPGKAYGPEVKRIYTNHLRDEVNTLIDLKNDIGSNIQYFSDNQRDRRTKDYLLTHFRDIITSDKSKNLLQRAIREENPDLLVNDSSVQLEIENYINDFIKRQQQTLIDTGIVQKTDDGRYRTKALSQEQLMKFKELKLNPNDFSQQEFDDLSRYLFINHQIAVREQHKLIYGHPALYKDLPKRSNGATSTKEAIVDDSTTIEWMDQNYPRIDGKVRSKDAVQTFNNISYRDVNVVSLFYKDMAEGMYASMIKDQPKSVVEERIGAKFNDKGVIVSLILDNGQPTGELAPYINDNEADAHAMILPDFYRDLLFLSAKWSALQNQQWDYEMAYERQQRSKRTDFARREYTPQEIKEGLPKKDAELVANGSPGAVFPVIKPQYFGYQTNPNMMHTTFLKHSAQPRFWRFFEGTNFEQIYVNAQSQQIDIIGYESGEKVGNVYNSQKQFTSFYNDRGQLIPDTPPIQRLLTKFYGIQVEMAAKLKDKVVRGTQMTKIIMSNIAPFGKTLKSEYQPVIQEYNEILRQMTRLGKQELLLELGLEQDGENYITKDLKKLVTTLRDEAVKRDLPSNIVEAFEASLGDNSTGLVYKFDSFSNRDKIDNILNAIVDSRVISHKVHGKPAVQAAVTLTEAGDRGLMYLNKDNTYEAITTQEQLDQLTETERKSVRLTSSDLKFYKLENGKTSRMEVLLPHWFEELYGKDDRLNISELDPRLLQLIGFRIPTQGMNSIDSIIVKGFLKPEEGDTVVVPSELTGKSGSDFDIDKLNIYIPNYKIIKGKPVYIEYQGDPFSATKEELENRLIELMGEMLSFPENYRQLVVPNGASTLKRLEQEILRLKGKTKDKVIPFTQLSEWSFMNETRERFLVGKQLVGIGAVHITNHALSQVSNILMATNPDLAIRFKHNVTPDGQIYLSGITNSEGLWISELLSEFLTGFVDAAKDPFVFELNINPATAGSYFYLLRTGASLDALAYFHTQPVITNYLAIQQVNESLLNKVNGDEMRKDYVRAIAMSEFAQRVFPHLIKDAAGNKADLRSLVYAASNDKGEIDFYFGSGKKEYPHVNALRKSLADVDVAIEQEALATKQYSPNSLKSTISDYYQRGEISTQQAVQQLVVLSDFLRYQDQGSELSAYVNALAYDTASTKSIVENVLQNMKYYAMVAQGFIENPEDVLSNTFLDVMKSEKEEIPKMFSNYFVFLHNNAKDTFTKMYDFISSEGMANLTDATKAEMLNKFQNFFLNYLLHTVRFNNPLTNREEQGNSYYRLFFNDSFAKQVRKFQKKYPDNKLLKELFPLVSSDRTQTDNVKLFVSKMSSYEANTIIESAVQLLEIAEQDPETKTFMNDLAMFSLVQSGVQASPISYTKVLPNELYARIAGTIFDRFTDSPNILIDPELVFNQFFQNYYFNRTIVPLAKGASFAAGILTVPNGYRSSNYPFVGLRVERLNPDTNKAYTTSERDALIKNKQWDTLFESNLYKAFYQNDKYTFYRPVNKLGNKQFAIETYTMDTYNMTRDQIALSPINDYVDERSFEPAVRRVIGEDSNPTTLPAPNERKVSITMQQHNIDKIIAGTKTSTVRSQREADSIGIPIGESAVVTFGNRDFVVLNNGLMSIDEAGGLENVLRTEGVSSINDFTFQQTKDWANGKGKLYYYTITPYNKPNDEQINEAKNNLDNCGN